MARGRTGHVDATPISDTNLHAGGKSCLNVLQVFHW